MDLFEFVRLFEQKRKRLRLPPDATFHEPEVEASMPPLTWQVTFFISFKDDLSIRIWESYDKFAGLQVSRRVQWSYHYGQYSEDSTGAPAKGEPDDPLVIRIDTSDGLHMHFNTRDPHYPPSRVQGLDLKSLDCWQFIKNVLKHRESGKEIEDVFGFKIVTK